MEVEIKGVYDGNFKWRQIAIERTSKKYRKQFEQQFREQYGK